MKKRFYTSPFRILVFAMQFAAVFALVGLGVMLIRWIDGDFVAVHAYNFFLFLSLASLGLFALLSLSGLIWHVAISPEGIRGSTEYGRFLTVRWESIADVRPATLMGLRYLRVEAADDHRVLLLPLFLHRQSEFEALVLQYAGTDNPLTRWLEQSRRPCLIV